MIAFIIAVAMLGDPGIKHVTAQKPAPAPAPAVRRVSTEAPVLSVVAVTLECTAKASGRVEGCQVLGETHPDLGFGEAAIALMRDAEVAPGPRDIQFARTIQFVP